LRLFSPSAVPRVCQTRLPFPWVCVAKPRLNGVKGWTATGVR
jgi:hypothetical protein